MKERRRGGMRRRNKARWPYIHAHLIENKEIEGTKSCKLDKAASNNKIWYRSKPVWNINQLLCINFEFLAYCNCGRIHGFESLCQDLQHQYLQSFDINDRTKHSITSLIGTYYVCRSKVKKEAYLVRHERKWLVWRKEWILLIKQQNVCGNVFDICHYTSFF